MSDQERIVELEEQVARLTGLLRRQLGGPADTLWFESGVTPAGEPFVHVRWGDQAGQQLSVGEGKQHALRLLEVVAAAELDAVLLRFLQEKLELPLQEAGMLLVQLRELRGDSATSSGEGQ